MADVDVDIIVEAISRGFDKVTADVKQVGAAAKTTGADLDMAGASAKTGGLSFASLQSAIVPVGVALAGVATAAVGVWNALKQGASLERAAEMFDNLTASINTTSDALLGRLEQATGGMISNAEMIAGASQIISLGLADNEEDVVRLSNLISQLGWDMQQVIMTFANDSKMRLDALGLSVTDVDERMQALIDSGVEASAAFDLAVIEAGEAKLELLGSAADTTEGDIRRLEASWKDLKTAGLALLTEAVGPLIVGLANLVGPPGAPDIPSAFDLARQADSIEEYLDLLRQAGISWGTLEQATAWFREGQMQRGAESADAAMLKLVDTWERVIKVLPGRARGQEGGLLGELIGDPGMSLARLTAVNDAMREAIRLRDEAMRMATTEQRMGMWGGMGIDPADLQAQFGSYYNFVVDKSQNIARLEERIAEIRREGLEGDGELSKNQTEELEKLGRWLERARAQHGQTGTGFMPDTEMANAVSLMVEGAAAAGAWSKQLYMLSGGADAVAEALRQAAIAAKAEELGQAVADRLIGPAEALQQMQDFIDGLDLNKIFELDEAIMGSRDRPPTHKEAMLEMEGVIQDTAPQAEGLAGTLDAIATPRVVDITTTADAADAELVPLEERLDTLTKGYLIPIKLDFQYGDVSSWVIEMIDAHFQREGTLP